MIYSMNTYLFLLYLLLTYESFTIFGIAKTLNDINDKNSESDEDLIDSEEYNSANDLFDGPEPKIRYFDYIPMAKDLKSSTPSTTHTSGQVTVNMFSNGEEEQKAEEGEGGSGGTLTIIVIVVVVLVVICALAATFIFLRKSSKNEDQGLEDVKSLADAMSSDASKPKESKMKANVNAIPTTSVVTVASDTGQPIHGKAAAAKPMATKPKAKSQALPLPTTRK